jgi:hypothetical protein
MRDRAATESVAVNEFTGAESPANEFAAAATVR